MISNLIEGLIRFGLATNTSAQTLGFVPALLSGTDREAVLERVVAYVEATYNNGVDADAKVLARYLLEQVAAVTRQSMEDAMYDIVEKAGDAGLLDVEEFFCRIDALFEDTAHDDDWLSLRAFVVDGLEAHAEDKLTHGDGDSFEAICQMAIAFCKAYDTAVVPA